MKKSIFTLGIITFLCLSMNTSAFAFETESNIPTDLENLWSKSNVMKLIEKKVINGYEDGTFRPDNEITVAELMKIIMKNNQIKLGESGYKWYYEYINGARELALIQGGEIDDYNRAITRGKMVVIISMTSSLRISAEHLSSNWTTKARLAVDIRITTYANLWTLPNDKYWNERGNRYLREDSKPVGVDAFNFDYDKAYIKDKYIVYIKDRKVYGKGNSNNGEFGIVGTVD